MDTLTSIKVFCQVIDSGSFVAAAERLDLSTAMVSKHVMHIEKRIGVRLLNRNNRTLSLTEPGKVYFERCKKMLSELDETELELTSLNGAPRGTLRVTGPSWIAGQRLADLLAEYRRRFPEVIVDISFDERIVDLVEEGFDVALRVTNHPLPGNFVARKVRSIPFVIGASREYLKRKGIPRSPEELAQHDMVALGNLSAWTFDGPDGKFEVPANVVLRYRSLAGVANAVATGIGMAPMPDVFFHDPVFKDVLVPVLTDHPFAEPTLYVVYVSRKHVPSKIRTFVDFVLEAIANETRPSSKRASTK